MSVHRDILEIIHIHKHALREGYREAGQCKAETHQEMVEPFYIKPDLQVSVKIRWRHGVEPAEMWQPHCPSKGDTQCPSNCTEELLDDVWK